ETAHSKPGLVEVLHPLGVNKFGPQQPRGGFGQLGLSVLSAAEQNSDYGNVPARLNNVAEQLVPMARHLIRLVGFAKNLANGPVVFGTLCVGVVLNIEAIAEVRLGPVRTEFGAAVVCEPQLAVLAIDHGRRVCDE